MTFTPPVVSDAVMVAYLVLHAAVTAGIITWALWRDGWFEREPGRVVVVVVVMSDLHVGARLLYHMRNLTLNRIRTLGMQSRGILGHVERKQ